MAYISAGATALVNLIKRRIDAAQTQASIDDLSNKIAVLYASDQLNDTQYSDLMAYLTARAQAIGLNV